MAMLTVEIEVASSDPKRPRIAPELVSLARRRRRARLLIFIIAESVVAVLTIAAMVAGISERFLTESFTGLFRMVPIIGAIVAALLPILFFGDPKRRNRPR
jgi:predicted PurR-regulated permease PerM